MNLLKRHIILTNEKKQNRQMLLALMRAIRRSTHTLLLTTLLSAAARLLSSGTLLCGSTLLLCSALVSCTPAEDVTDTGNPTLPADAEVPLSVQSVDIEGGLEVLTRATNYSELKTEGSVITIYRLSDENYPTAITTGARYRYTGGSWKPVSYANGTFTEDQTKAIKLGAKDCRNLLYAFYSPEATYSFSTSSSGYINLSSEAIYSVNWQKKGKKDPIDKSAWKYDFCYSLPSEAEAATPATEVYNFHPKVKFSMKRVFTQLAIKVTRGNNYAGAGEIGIKLKLNNALFNNNGKFDTATGKLVLDDPYGGETTKKYEYNPSTYQYFDLKKKNDVYEDGVLIFSPGIIMKDGYTISDFSLIVDIEADGIKLADLTIPNSQLTTLMNTDQTGFDMQAGTKYVLNLKLDYRSLELEGVQVAQWETKTPIDANAGFEWDTPGAGIQVAKADINETTAAAGHAMACTENDKELLSELIWARGNVVQEYSHYNWVPKQEDFGTLYDWATAVESCKYFGEDRNNIDPNTSNWDRFGTGWRLPTKKELDALSHCRGNDDENKNGTWYMNSTSGVFLPWTTITSDTAGEIGNTGYYWSGTESGSDKAYYLKEGRGGGGKISYTSVEDNKGAKTNQYSVRCVKKAVQ